MDDFLIKKQLALSYKVLRLSAFIDQDLKVIKKINGLFGKFEKTKKEIYFFEILNIFKFLDNHFDLNKLYFVLCQLIDLKYIDYLNEIMEKFDKFDYKKISKKFKDMSYE